MVNIVKEKALTLHQAAAMLPGSKGKSLSYTTVHRWVTCGFKGVRLEANNLGGRWVTSIEAIQRFMERLTAPEFDALSSHGTADDDRRLMEAHGI